MNKENIAKDLFYGLLRMSLWADNEELVRREIAVLERHAYTPGDWEWVCHFAAEQTVLGLLDSVIERLPEALWPPKGLRLRMVMHANKVKQMHAVLNRSLCSMVQELNGAGIYSVVLKGQGIAQDYALPEARQCGDLDIWVGNEVYLSVCDTIQKAGVEADFVQARTTKHINFTYNHSTVEIHRFAATLLYGNKDKSFQAWTDACLKSTQRCMWVCPDWRVSRTSCEGAVQVMLPPATFNALFIFLHLYRHFIYGGVGLRQLCDWCRCLYVHRDEIDLVELEARLKEFKLYRPWQVFGALCVECLGLPQECMPCYTERYRENVFRVQTFVERDGNFGHTAMRGRVRPRSLIAGKWFALRHQMRRFFTVFGLFPMDVVSTGIEYITFDVKVAWCQWVDRCFSPKSD
jgi:hypothetical protein